MRSILECKIKFLVIFILVIILMRCHHSTENVKAVMLMPLRVGNFWIYGAGFTDDESNQFDGFKIEITGKLEIQYNETEKEVFVFRLSELQGEEWSFLQNVWFNYEDNGLYLYYYNPNTPYEILRVMIHRNPMEIGDEWQSVMNEEASCTENEIEITTNAGVFDCYEITSSNGKGYFCPEVGFVKGLFYIAFWHVINTSLLEYGTTD